MAEENALPAPKDFTQMSADELHALIEKEGSNFVQQTENGDIGINEYLESEGFDLPRIMNLFFAFEYFERTPSGFEAKSYKSEYAVLYGLLYDRISKFFGDQTIYGPEYIVNL